MSKLIQVRSRRGFTLVELLVVIGIIALLISILLPALARARDSANAVKCQSNLKTLMTAFLMFAQDHKNALPGGKHDVSSIQPDPDKRCWLTKDGLSTPADWRWAAPTQGTIFRYVSGSDVRGDTRFQSASETTVKARVAGLKGAQIYRCPSRSDNAIYSAGAGSNGMFDFAVFNVWPGAKLNMIKQRSRIKYQDGSGKTVYVNTPIIVEEQPESINQTNIEGGHSNTDMLAHTHMNGSYYARIDGGTEFVIEPKNTQAKHWEFEAPSGNWVTGVTDNKWGGFNLQ